MSLAHARALTNSPRIEKFNPERDFRALYRLAVWALKFAPLVGLDSELINGIREGKDVSCLHNGLILDITGTERLHKKEESLTKIILDNFYRSSIDVRISIAPTIGAAWALSRYRNSPISIIEPKASIKNSLSTLPIDALRISIPTITYLNEMGIYKIGELLKLPKKALFQRFLELSTRIDQTLNDLPEVIHTIETPFEATATRAFESPLTREEDIKKIVFELLKSTLIKLKEKSHGICNISLTLDTVAISGNTATIRKDIPLNAPSRDISKIYPVITVALESIKIVGGVKGCTLSASNTEQVYNEQLNFLSTQSNNHSINDLINTLVAKIGQDHVTTVEFNNSHIPEHSFKHKTILNKRTQSLDYPDLERPSYILIHPEPILALSMMPDKPPSWLKWKGKEHKIIKSLGPERISDEWWHKAATDHIKDRDYFKVQDDTGRWLWIYRDSYSMKWFVHGVWG